MDSYSLMLWPIWHPKLKRPLVEKISGVQKAEKLKNDLWKRSEMRKFSEKNRDLDGNRTIGVA